MARVRTVANIQVLRGLAAFLVVLFHIQPALSAFYPNIPHLRIGAFGVDIFFVISGFVMVHANRAMDRSPIDFLVARVIRIVPLYWLATSVIVALYVVGFKPVGVYHLTPRMVAESALFVPSTFPDGRVDLVLSIGWTLMYEFFFYLWFALLMPLRSANRTFGILAILFVLIAGISRLFTLPYLVDFYTSPIILEFLFGGALALAWPTLAERGGALPGASGWLLILLGFALVLAQDALHLPVPHKEDWRFLAYGLPAALIVAGALVLESGGRRGDRGFAPLLGAASYALYLFHPVIVQFTVKVFVHPLHRLGPGAPWVVGLLALAGSIVGAIVIHLFVEKRLLAWGRHLAGRRASPHVGIHPRSI